MNAKLTALLLALTVLPAAASDLVSFPDGKPQDLNDLKPPSASSISGVRTANPV